MKNLFKKQNTLLIALFAMLLFSCKKEDANDPNIIEKTINQTISNNFNLTGAVESDANHLEIDIDGDGQNDLTFETFFEKPNEDATNDTIINAIGIFVDERIVNGTYQSNGDVLIFGTYFFDYLATLKKVSEGSSISSSLNNWDHGGFVYAKLFRNTSILTSAESGETNSDQLIPFRFKIGSAMHYGWIKVNLSSDFKVLNIKEVAYQKNPNTAIEAGAK